MLGFVISLGMLWAYIQTGTNEPVFLITAGLFAIASSITFSSTK